MGRALLEFINLLMSFGAALWFGSLAFSLEFLVRPPHLSLSRTAQVPVSVAVT